MQCPLSRRGFLFAPLALGLIAGCLASFDDRPFADAGPPTDALPLPDGTTTPDALRPDAGPNCGNGEPDDGEACDDGPLNSDTTPDACRTHCGLPICGDNVVDPGRGEACDDGNASDGDGCSAACTLEIPVCGDGAQSGSEACDDGNLVNGDGCSSVCQLEALPVLHRYGSSSVGWVSQTLTWASDPHAPQQPVVAAAGMEPDAKALLFTTSNWHLLTLPGGEFESSGDLATAFPGLPTAELQTATGQWDQVASRHTVMFITGGMVYVYSYAGTPATGATLELGPVDISTQSDWQTAHAPPPTSVVAEFLDVYNTHGWVTTTIAEACGSGPDVQMVGHMGFLSSDDQLHLYDASQCFEFFDTVPLSSFGPFVEAGAPLSGITAMFYLEPGDTLYVITQ